MINNRILPQFVVLMSLFLFLFAYLGADELQSQIPPNPVAQKQMQKVNEAKAELKSVDITELQELQAGDKPFRLIDVRTRAEYDQGHIAGAEWVSRGTIDFDAMKGKLGETSEFYILYCKKSPRGVLAAKSLQDIGYENVNYLVGGFLGWIEAGNSLYNRHGEVKIVAFEKKEGE